MSHALAADVAEEPDSPFTDDELAALAMAADPDAVIPDDAVPFDASDADGAALLPAWYMPAPSLRASRTKRVVFAIIVIALLAINVAGFCVTYGFPDPVW